VSRSPSSVDASRSRRPRRSQGLTLIEVLIATTVLSIAAVVAFPTMLSFVALSDAAREKNVATHDLTTALEDVAATPFDQVTKTYANGLAIPKFAALHLSKESIVVAYDDPAADPLIVTLTMTWNDAKGRPLKEVMRCAHTR
jgi:prepilin-type N-terminal cleavage/methylation domain-containing protein